MTDGVDRLPYRYPAKGPASSWTPRQALLDALNAIDSGEIAPEVLVVCMGVREAREEDGGTNCLAYFRCSSPDMFSTFGLLRMVQEEMLK